MGQQIALYEELPPAPPSRAGRPMSKPSRGVCAACRGREARYGFRDERHPDVERPRALCFECFRVEIVRRQAAAARLARGWNGVQTDLPLAETLERLDRARRRAQIAARHALDQAG